MTSSTASHDLGDKLKAFRRNGVREYIVWRVLDQELDWFVLRKDTYHGLTPGTDGIARSEGFPGLWLDVAALLERRHADVAKALQAGLATTQHAEFVERLLVARAE